MRLVCCQAPAEIEYFGVDTNVGSRDETSSHHGLAHFVEHTIFKGTLRRRAYHINNRMEAVGGELNAYTTKEETLVYTVAPRGNLARSIELVADLLMNSQFPAAELSREREVVRDEIDSYLDTPSESVFDDFEDLFFAGSQLGHNILGTAESLDSLTSEVCRSYLAENFHASRMTACYLGREKPENVLRKVQREFSDIRTEGAPLNRVRPAAVAPFNLRRDIDTHQSHTVLGASIPGIDDLRCDAIALVCNILGGPGMNSRLNLSLRERRGLVYAVDASTSIFSDCGLLNIYFGCDPADRDRCLELVLKELRKISMEPLTPRALAAAKKQFIGQLTVSSSSLEQTVLSAARAVTMNGRVRLRREVVDSIASITPDDVLAVASMLRPEVCSVLSLG